MISAKANTTRANQSLMENLNDYSMDTVERQNKMIKNIRR